jgi:Tol biopolymer transport system component
MNTNGDRRIFEFLDGMAGQGSPDYLDEILSRTARTRQRPGWTSIERWLHMDLSARRSVFSAPIPWRPIALLIALVLAFVAFALAAGSRHAPAPPFGLARNGAIMVSRDGNIYAIDPATSVSSLAIGGDPFDFSPVFSRDGSKLMFMRSASEPATDTPFLLSLMVANADGSGVRSLTDPLEVLAWFDWSPSGSQIAYVAEFGKMSVVNADGSGSRTLDVGRPAHFVTWLPPDGSEILFRGERSKPSDPPPGIFAVRPDGSGVPRKISTKAPNNDDDYQSLTVSPDGSRVSFSRFSSSGSPSVVVLDVKTGEETVLRTPDRTSQRGGGVFSPDGKLVAFSRIYADGAYQLVLAPADGSTLGTVLGPRMVGDTEGTTYTFTPDGTAVIAGYGQDDGRTSYRLPVDGSPSSVLSQRGSFSFTDIQRLAP